VFNDVRARAELSSDITFHSLRHYFATKCLFGGVELHELSDLLGHRWVSSTTYYLHVADDRFDRAREALTKETRVRYGSGFLRVIDGGGDY